jgi:hypothetical protein
MPDDGYGPWVATFEPFHRAPKDGRWLVALCNDRETVMRISWGRDREGKLAWCSTTRSLGAGLFCGFIQCPRPPLTGLAAEVDEAIASI